MEFPKRLRQCRSWKNLSSCSNIESHSPKASCFFEPVCSALLPCDSLLGTDFGFLFPKSIPENESRGRREKQAESKKKGALGKSLRIWQGIIFTEEFYLINLINRVSTTPSKTVNSSQPSTGDRKTRKSGKSEQQTLEDLEGIDEFTQVTQLSMVSTTPTKTVTQQPRRQHRKHGKAEQPEQ